MSKKTLLTVMAFMTLWLSSAPAEAQYHHHHPHHHRFVRRHCFYRHHRRVCRYY